MKIKNCLFLLICFISFSLGFSQDKSLKGNVIIDDNGVMRWEHSQEEVHGFGVNYTVPFAHAYRSAKRLGVDVKKAIDNDIYHFTRLGFDLYRIHVWDTEISDVNGNLIVNEHLDAFDYLLKKLKENNINFVITPIAFWGNGWPEPDTESPGFSSKYGKADCLTNPEAIKAQQNYLYQFINHVNPYTGIAYKDEPNIIAFEVSNEPHHKGEAKNVTDFVSKMVTAIKKTGTKKPVFYNMSHAVHFMDAYFKGGAQGGTFQWYPTGLGYGKELSGNLLPNVNDYNMPFDSIIKKHNGAKLVYEFDAADVGKSYIYPTMARSFRTAGIQIGTHFAYDPTFLAPFNTEYNTHYMNLNYAPQKALSLKIASEVFHEIPMHSQYGTYPENNEFGNFKVNYEQDLAEYNSKDKFFYTNTTTSTPVNEKHLKEIAGYGNSKLVSYNGLGAYFLDKIDKNSWRLEVMPDAIWVDNLFGKNSSKKTVAVINWDIHTMSLNIKDLGTNFNIEAINEGNTHKVNVSENTFIIKPGTYIVSKSGAKKRWSKQDVFKTNTLNAFYAPQTTVSKPWFNHASIEEVSENTPLNINLQYVAPEKPDSVKMVGYLGSKRFTLDMNEVTPYQYNVTIPAEAIKTGYLYYHILVETGNKTVTYPAGKEGKPNEWDFYDTASYKTTVVGKSNPVYLFEAINDSDNLVRQWKPGFKLMPTQNNNEAEYQIHLKNLFEPDVENLNAKPIYDYTFKHFVLENIKGRVQDLNNKNTIVVKARSLNNKVCKLQVALVLNDGSAYGTIINITPEIKEHKLEVQNLKPVKTVTLPRPYPSFLPYNLEHHISSDFDITKLESIQFSIGPEMSKDEQKDTYSLGLINVRLD
ncbi:hypothetical protein [Corallibacter sp.]|uniref:hypothetical protein n=1 Tax=Corallibacter sp. TaxID=2038084 RepID=UPI003AB64C91